MSFGTLFNRLAGAPQPPAPMPPEPLKLRRGGFVEIDPLPFRMLKGLANFELGSCAQPIAARGLVDLNGSWLHRYYFDDDETWLQVKTDNGTGDECVSECILWQYWEALTPANHAELATIAGSKSAVESPVSRSRRRGTRLRFKWPRFGRIGLLFYLKKMRLSGIVTRSCGVRCASAAC